jgi:N-acetyl-gamma-glutamylphosphate reductase
MASKLKTAILGATGYSGFELARILLRHPGVETPVMLQRSGEAAPEVKIEGRTDVRSESWSDSRSDSRPESRSSRS